MIDHSTPRCIICGNPVKLNKNKTCSIECRSIAGKTTQQARIDKQKATLMEKYGVTNIRNMPGARDKRQATMLEKYGANVSSKTREAARNRAPELNTRGRKTLKEKYGVDNPGQLENHRVKCVETQIANYGEGLYYGSHEFQEKSIKKRLEKYDSLCPTGVTFLEIANPDEMKQAKYENPNKLISFKCNACNKTDSLPSETFKWRIRNLDTPCSTCGEITHGSGKEATLKRFIRDELKIAIVENAKVLTGKQEIDVYVPLCNIGFEFNGLYWHNDLRIDKNYHKQKQLDAKNNGIQLIHIFEDDWDHKQEIVKSRIRNVLGMVSAKIYARNCEIRIISSKDAKKFLNENHIQGYVPSTTKIGLYNNDALVSIMTFSTPNLSRGHKKKEGVKELSRFCSLLNTSVIGGASKLFKHYCDNYHPNEILSFSDNCWSTTEGVYKILEFDYVSDTGLNYWYADMGKIKRIHRFSLRKTKDDIQSLTEYENRLAQGYKRIWDCGSTKWIWKRPE